MDWRVALLHAAWLHIPVSQVLMVGMTEVVFDEARGARRTRSRQAASEEAATETKVEEH